MTSLKDGNHKWLTNNRLSLVNCSYGFCPEGKPIIKAWWVFTLGLLSPTETLVSETGQEVVIETQEWMQQDRNGGELYDSADTCDFYLAKTDE